MSRSSEFFQKTGIIISFAALCGVIGFAVPMLFDRDMGGALASALLGIGGAVFGLVLGCLTVRRNFGCPPGFRLFMPKT